MTGETEPGDVVAVNRHEVVALCLAALDAVGADRRAAELLVESALFAEDRGKSVVGVAHLSHRSPPSDGLNNKLSEPQRRVLS